MLKKLFPSRSNSVSEVTGWRILRNAAFIVALIGAIYLLISQMDMLLDYEIKPLRGIWALKGYALYPWYVLLGFMASHRLKPSRKVRYCVGAAALVFTVAITAMMLYRPYYFFPQNHLLGLIPLLLMLFAFVLAPSRIRLHRGARVGVCLLIFVLSSLLYFAASYLAYGGTTMIIRENRVHILGLVFIVNCSQVLCAFCIAELAMSRIAFKAMAPGVVKLVVVLVAFFPWLDLCIREVDHVIFFSPYNGWFSRLMLLINPLTLAIIVYVPAMLKALSDKNRNLSTIKK